VRALRLLLAVVTLLVASFLAHAQPVREADSVLGRYKGSYTVLVAEFGFQRVGVTLEITSAAGGTVTGKAIRGSAPNHGTCRGDYKVAGTLKGKSLVLRSIEKSGLARDCDIALDLTWSGKKLVGTVDGNEAKFSK